MPEPQTCASCGSVMLSVLYYDAGGNAVGGHFVCSNCGPRSAIEVTAPDDVRRTLLERKAS